MSQHSKLPAIHGLLQYIPYPGASWNEVITTYPSLSHLHWSLIFGVLNALLQLICYVLTELTTPHVMSFLLNRGMHPLDIKKNKERYKEMLFPFFSRILTLSFGLYSVYDKEWLYDRQLFYAGWPHDQQLDCCVADIKLLYFVHIGFYMNKLFNLFYLDRHLKDFNASLTHHLVTLFLLALSYYRGLLRVGFVIILLHDPADIIMQIARFFRMMQIEIMLNISFLLFIIVWVVTRVIIYPYHCVLSGLVDFWVQHPDCDVGMRTTGYILTGLMCLLYGLHLYWTKLLMVTITSKLKGKLRDVRSESERSDDEQDKTQ